MYHSEQRRRHGVREVRLRRRGARPGLGGAERLIGRKIMGYVDLEAEALKEAAEAA